MRPQLWVAALILFAFVIGLVWVWGREPDPPARRTVRSGASLHLAEPAAPEAVAKSAAGPAERDQPPADASQGPVDPTGVEVRRLVRDAVLLRRQRDWARLAALQDRVVALSRRDLNILLHILKTEADSEAALSIGDLLARHEEIKRSSALAGARATLARVFRRLAEPPAPTAADRDLRERAIKHLARWSRVEDVDFLIALLRSTGDTLARQAAGLAIADQGDPRLWSSRLQESAASAGDLRGAALLALALAGVARRAEDASGQAWVKDALLPTLRVRMGLAPEKSEALDALTTVSLVTGDSLAAEWAEAWAVADPSGRARLLPLLPEVAASGEDVALLRARLTVEPGTEIDGVLVELEERAGGR